MILGRLAGGVGVVEVDCIFVEVVVEVRLLLFRCEGGKSSSAIRCTRSDLLPVNRMAFLFLPRRKLMMTFKSETLRVLR